MDASNIAKGIWHSIKGLKQSAYYGAKHTFISTGAVGYDRKLRSDRENEGFYQRVTSLINNEEPLRRLVTTVITEFYRKLDAQGKDVIHNQLAYGAGRIGGQVFVLQTIAMAIINNSRRSFVFKALYRFGAAFTISTALWQGLIKEAAGYRTITMSCTGGYSRKGWT